MKHISMNESYMIYHVFYLFKKLYKEKNYCEVRYIKNN